jgi:hypothetical protein
MNLFLFNPGKVDQTALHFFQRYARIPAPALIGFDARLGTMEQLLGSQTRNNDEAKAGVYPRPGSFIGNPS